MNVHEIMFFERLTVPYLVKNSEYINKVSMELLIKMEIQANYKTVT